MYASQPLSSLKPEDSVTLRRPFGKSIRRNLSMRRSVRLSSDFEVENEIQPVEPSVESSGTQINRLRVFITGVCGLLSWLTFICVRKLHHGMLIDFKCLGNRCVMCYSDEWVRSRHVSSYYCGPQPRMVQSTLH